MFNILTFDILTFDILTFDILIFNILMFGILTFGMSDFGPKRGTVHSPPGGRAIVVRPEVFEVAADVNLRPFADKARLLPEVRRRLPKKIVAAGRKELDSRWGNF
jgi:hypothetical protein